MEGTTRTGSLVDGLITRARDLDDEDLRTLADARAAVDETFHGGAWRAAVEHAATLSGAHAVAWVHLGTCFIPTCLEGLVQQGSSGDAAELGTWQDVARRARLAIDDALLAYLGADTIRPPDIRELLAPWKKMLEESHRREVAGNQ